MIIFKLTLYEVHLIYSLFSRVDQHLLIDHPSPNTEHEYRYTLNYHVQPILPIDLIQGIMDINNTGD
jgi:hypothetical protein